jgi:hypothetical protein
MIANALSKGDRCIRGGAAAPQVKGASRLRWHGEKKTSLWQRSGKAITTVLRRASICEGLITDSLPARGGIGVGESQAYSRHRSIHSRRYQTPLSTSFTLCNRSHRSVSGRTVVTKPPKQIMDLESRQLRCQTGSHTHPRSPEHSTLSLSLARSSTGAESAQSLRQIWTSTGLGSWLAQTPNLR